MTKTAETNRAVWRVTFFSLFAVICLAQCYTIVRNFFSYPYVIDMYESFPESLGSYAPAVTVCNNNRMSLKKLVKRNELVARSMDARYPNWFKSARKHLYNADEFTQFRDYIGTMFNQIGYDPQDEMANTSMNDLFAMKPEASKFLHRFGCIHSRSETLNCNLMSRIESLQDRCCVTLMHKGALYYDNLWKVDAFNVSTMGDDDDKGANYLSARDIAKFRLDFEPEDYADLKRQIGARVIIHDNRFVSASTEVDYFVTRGYRYEFTIEREHVKLIDKPYLGCRDYESDNLHRYARGIDAHIPMNGQTCHQNCMISNIVRRSKCWPSTMPYFRNDSLDPQRDLKSCPWLTIMSPSNIYGWIARAMAKRNKQRRRSRNRQQQASSSSTMSSASNVLISQADGIGATVHKMNRSADEEMRAYARIRRFCWSQCERACQATQYSVTVTKSVWPSDVKIMFDNKTGHMRELRHCCAMILIKFLQYSHNVQEYKPKYIAVDTVGNVGGLLAVWLGFSIVSVYKATQKLLDLISDKRHEQKVQRAMSNGNAAQHATSVASTTS